MSKKIKAKYSNGVLEPLEVLELPEGYELTIEILNAPEIDEFDTMLNATAGAWQDSVDTEQMKKDIYMDRLSSNRPVPEL